MPTVTLASAPITKVDQLEVELHRPATEPAFILIKWPGLGAPTVCSPPQRFMPAALAIIAVMNVAMAELYRQEEHNR
jgi:hypothetical protein